MSANRETEEPPTRSKKRRKVISLEEKLAIIARHENGATKAKIGRDVGISESTVRHIIQHAEQYKKRLQNTPMTAAFQMTRNRTALMIEMEHLLLVWMEDCKQKGIPINVTLIKAKAVTLFEDLKKKEENPEKEERFVASSGWFHRFKKRCGINNIHVQGESASADALATAKLKIIIEENGYTDEQIFNVDETSLYWKKMPNKTYLAENEKSQSGFKASKDRMTLIVGGNAAGDFKIKPLLVYTSHNPYALRGYSKRSLPVHWRAHRKAWVTRTIFEEWFKKCFCIEVRNYCLENNIPFNILLILDNAPGHLTSLNDLCPNVRVAVLPPMTTSSLKPMAQGITSTFKAYYLRQIFSQAVTKTTGETAIKLTQFWDNYDVRDALQNIKEAWDLVSPSNMRAVWRNILPHCATDFHGFEVEMKSTIAEINSLGMELGFIELDEESIEELLQSHDKELELEDLIHLDEDGANDDLELEDEETEAETKEFTMKELEDIFRIGELYKQTIVDSDPNLERSLGVISEIDKAVFCYKAMYEDEKRKYSEPAIQLEFIKTE